MSYFIVFYEYSAAEDELNRVRPTHREYLKSRSELVMSGPYVGGDAGAALIFQADNLEHIEEIVSKDPFMTAGFIGSWSAREWNPVAGKLVAHL